MVQWSSILCPTSNLEEADSLDLDFLTSQVVIHEVVMFHPDLELLQESFPPKNFLLNIFVSFLEKNTSPINSGRFLDFGFPVGQEQVPEYKAASAIGNESVVVWDGPLTCEILRLNSFFEVMAPGETPVETLEESVIYSDLFDEKVKQQKSMQPVTNTKVK